MTDEQKKANSERASKWYHANKERVSLRAKAHYYANRDRILARHKKYKKENRAKITARDRETKLVYQRKQFKTNILFRLSMNLRNRLNRAIERDSKQGSAVRDLGCTIPELKVHLEGLFQDGMTWDNYGEWHIDHVRPLATFDLTNRDEHLKACHYMNLQPLWKRDNLAKGKNYSFADETL